MGGTLNHPIPQNMNDWMRLIERRMLTQERREPAFAILQRLGPGLAKFAHQVVDWNTENTWMTGHYWSDIGSLHSPDETKQWLGFTKVAADHGGVQELVTLDGTIRKQRPFSFNPGGLPTFGAWTDFGGGSGGGPPTGVAGGDLQGFYPNPELAGGVVGTLELADNSVTSAKIVNGTITQSDLAFTIPAAPVLLSFPSPATSWNGVHNLNQSPVDVTLMNAAGEEFMGDVTFPDANRAQATFGIAVAGYMLIQK